MVVADAQLPIINSLLKIHTLEVISNSRRTKRSHTWTFKTISDIFGYPENSVAYKTYDFK